MVDTHPASLDQGAEHGTGYVLVRDPTIAVSLALLGCVLIVVYAAWVRSTSRALTVGVGLQAGGALSNLVDRLLYAGVTEVTDYINVTLRSRSTSPTSSCSPAWCWRWPALRWA